MKFLIHMKKTSITLFSFSETKRQSGHLLSGHSRGRSGRYRLRQGLHLHLQDRLQGRRLRAGRLLRRVPGTQGLKDCPVTYDKKIMDQYKLKGSSINDVMLLEESLL